MLLLVLGVGGERVRGELVRRLIDSGPVAIRSDQELQLQLCSTHVILFLSELPVCHVLIQKSQNSNITLSTPPSLLQSMVLYWFTSSLVGLSHNLLLRSAAVHKILQLRTQRSQSPYRDLLSAFLSKYCK